MTLSYDIHGDGPTVVLLHSSVCDRRMWDPQVPVLTEAGYRVVRFDFRGFGETPVADRPYSDAGDVCDLLDHLECERYALIGSSHGGEVALEVAATRTDAVASLVLLCAGMPGHVPGPELRAFIERENALLAADDVAGAVQLNLATWMGPEAKPEARQLVRVMQRHALDTQRAARFASAGVPVDLARITAPCLAVSGAHDLADFREIAVGLPGQIPGARHLELPWAGHVPSLERPDEVTGLLIDFLSTTFPAQ
jgi:pimeloyl-ACP methyl ester carboxylesterase